MKKENTDALLERGTMVRCMGAGGVVVASSRSLPADKEGAARAIQQMA